MAKQQLQAVISLDDETVGAVNATLSRDGKTVGGYCAELLALEVRVRKEHGCGLAELVEQVARHMDFWRGHVGGLLRKDPKAPERPSGRTDGPDIEYQRDEWGNITEISHEMGG